MGSNDKTNLRPDPAAQPNQKSPSAFFWVLLALMLLAFSAAIYLGKQKSASKDQEPRAGKTSEEISSPTIRKFPSPSERISEAGQIIPGPTDATGAQLLAQLNDSASPTKARRGAGRALARMASAEAFDAVKAALGDAAIPSYVKAAIAEGLGENSLPEARMA